MDAKPATGSELRVTSAAGASVRPALAWTGRDLLVVWDDSRTGGGDLYLSRIAVSDGALTEVVDDVLLTRSVSAEGYASAAWTGAGLQVAWEDSRHGGTEIYTAQFDADGQRQGDEVRLTSTPAPSYDPSLVWADGEIGVAYDDGGEDVSDVFIARLDADGKPLAAAVQRSNDPARSARVSLAWNGAEYAVAWEDTRGGNSDAYVARMSSTGRLAGGEVAIAKGDGAAEAVSLIAAGTGFALAWEDTGAGSYAIQVARLDDSGGLIGVTKVSTGSGNARNASLAWTGDRYGVVWDQGGAIHMAVLDADGKVVRPAAVLSADAERASIPALIWTGRLFAAAWSERRDGNEEIYVRTVAP